MIRRFRLNDIDQDDVFLWASEGDWCRWSDVAPIIAERDSLAAFAEERKQQINELMDENERLRTMLQGCLYFNEIATYDNGVSHEGMNEGDVHARWHYQNVDDYLQRIAKVAK